jgi:hypothetical protein
MPHLRTHRRADARSAFELLDSIKHTHSRFWTPQRQLQPMLASMLLRVVAWRSPIFCLSCWLEARMARKKANSLTQSELNDLLLAAIVVQERITSCMLSLWLTAVPTDKEYRARLGAIRSSPQTGLNGLPQGVSERATLLLRKPLIKSTRKSGKREHQLRHLRADSNEHEKSARQRR